MPDPTLFLKYGKLEVKAVGALAIATVLAVIILIGRLWAAW